MLSHSHRNNGTNQNREVEAFHIVWKKSTCIPKKAFLLDRVGRAGRGKSGEVHTHTRACTHTAGHCEEETCCLFVLPEQSLFQIRSIDRLLMLPLWSPGRNAGFTHSLGAGQACCCIYWNYGKKKRKQGHKLRLKEPLESLHCPPDKFY